MPTRSADSVAGAEESNCGGADTVVGATGAGLAGATGAGDTGDAAGMVGSGSLESAGGAIGNDRAISTALFQRLTNPFQNGWVSSRLAMSRSYCSRESRRSLKSVVGSDSAVLIAVRVCAPITPSSSDFNARCKIRAAPWAPRLNMQ